MIHYEQQLKMQAWLDRELPPEQKAEVDALLSANSEARALLEELRTTNGALAGFEAEIKLPESREFFWSKIQREIGRPEPAPTPAVPWHARWRKWLLPAGAVAAVAVAGLVAVMRPGAGVGGGPEFEFSLADSGGMVYRDYESGTTLVWFAYPAEEDILDTEPDVSFE
jgi:anti-sigma factor RsiW